MAGLSIQDYAVSDNSEDSSAALQRYNRGGLRVTEALKILQQVPKDAARYQVALACAFTPLHLQTFLAACLQRSLPGRRVVVTPGLYGDTAGTLESLKETAVQAVAVALEWADLDPRLGYRATGKWGPSVLADILSGSRHMLDRIAASLERLPSEVPVAISLPTLALPPLFHTPGWQMVEAEVALRQNLFEFASCVARRRGSSLVNWDRLAQESPPGSRFDLKSELLTGLPYTVPHAAAVASALARLLAPPLPKKGIISDLDDTLWGGIAGEIGSHHVGWDLAGRNHLHGLYQRLLAAFAEEGVLLGVASKNDPSVVRQVFERQDLYLASSSIFPMDVSWNAKSAAVGRILRTWNISGDAVVFVDDSPMELAEVSAAHPDVECLLFPKDDYAACGALLDRLRDLFGKPRISSEDAIRLESIRRSSELQQTSHDGSSLEAFLQQAGAAVTFDFSEGDPRVLELVNKTNQFSLNGTRYTEGEWGRRLAGVSALLAAVSYRDKFGPLGKIAVMQGWQEGGTLRIETWVMSCRAFSRRIEHQCLKMLFERYHARELFLDFRPTPRNGPMRDFLAAISGSRPDGPFTLTRAEFEKNCPALYHSVCEAQFNLSPTP
jgi:FkbH-like protein